MYGTGGVNSEQGGAANATKAMISWLARGRQAAVSAGGTAARRVRRPTVSRPLLHVPVMPPGASCRHNKSLPAPHPLAHLTLRNRLGLRLSPCCSEEVLP
ncbi:unnamed protein product [Arctia plantaginis]|uniref:Uncharacterized protein n=1 Tax=Arctia plantaginis TaxID=874455 RepID=A0A8S1AZK2_ARCPL|nr:unnamed protein product [Arctia plantaginis]CAB3259951.1 unnamed protein product [Arctia plantaginis]